MPRSDVAMIRRGPQSRAPSRLAAPFPLCGPYPAFTPSVDVAADGTVGVTYYDFRNNTSDPATLWTDYFLVHSHDHGLTWASETQITSTSFDMATAPDAGGYFTGDYLGLDHVGDVFAPFVILANSGNTANRTDGFFTYVGP